MQLFALRNRPMDKYSLTVVCYACWERDGTSTGQWHNAEGTRVD